MIDRDAARGLALAEIHRPKPYNPNPIECVILDEFTREEDFGWVFFYQSRRYVETGDYFEKLGGNAPIIVNRHDGSVHVTGTGHPTERYIEQYRGLLSGELKKRRV